MTMIGRSFRVIRNALTSKKVVESVETAENILFSNASVGDVKAIEAASNLVSSMCSKDTKGVIDGGIFVMAKARDADGGYTMHYKRLTVAERALIDQKPTMLADPELVLQHLEGARSIPQARIEYLRDVTKS